VKFEDGVLVRLATAGLRPALFDSGTLEQFVTALYDTSFVTVEGPFQAVFDQLDLGVAVPRIGSLEGEWAAPGSSERTAVNVRMTGAAGGPLQVDALWRGFIVARETHPTGHLRSVSTTLPSPGAIDADIVKTLGALPADAATLETERRKRLLAALKAAVSEPNVISDGELDRLLTRMGAASVNDYFDRLHGAAALETVRVTIDEPAPPASSPKPLPVAAAILIRNAGFSVSQLLAESRAARDQLEPMALGRAENGLKRRRDLLVVWIVPGTVFDDPDWPGATQGMAADVARQARRTAAGQWLANEGIGLAPIP
jgi:hypothetical protein